MKEVPIYTYLNQNTFGVVTEPFKPHIHAVVSTAGFGTMFLVAVKIGLIIFAALSLVCLLGAWAGISDAKEEMRKEAIEKKLKADAVRGGFKKL